MAPKAPASERLAAARVRDFSALIEENTLEFVLGPHRKKYVAHDMPLKFWLRRLARPQENGGPMVSDLEIVAACLRVTDDELLEKADVGMVEIAWAAQVLVDHFLAATKDLEKIKAMLRRPDLLSALYQITPAPSPSVSTPTPDTPLEPSST